MSKHTGKKPEDSFEEGKDTDYEVGYGKPPKHGQFKPGNKHGKGRKKGSKGIKTIVNEAFGMQVKGSLGGKPTKLSKTEAGMHQLATRFSQGDPKATDKAIPLLERYGPQDDPDGPSVERIEANLNAMEAYFALRRQVDSFEGEGDDD